MLEGVYLAFDFGTKRIGVAVGQRLTLTASPLNTLKAEQGVPQWSLVDALVKAWRPEAFIVGLPVCIDGKAMHTTALAKKFANRLAARFSLPAHLVDERLTSVEARAQLFEKGGFRKIKKTEVDSLAACIILEQWLRDV